MTTRYEAGEREVGRRPNTRTPDDRGRLAPLAGEGRGGVVERGTLIKLGFVISMIVVSFIVSYYCYRFRFMLKQLTHKPVYPGLWPEVHLYLMGLNDE